MTNNITEEDYNNLKQFEQDFFEMQGLIYRGFQPSFSYSWDEDTGFYTVFMSINKFVMDIKRFVSNDEEYNRLCAEELVDLLNRKQ